jgi:hypothetical protein
MTDAPLRRWLWPIGVAVLAGVGLTIFVATALSGGGWGVSVDDAIVVKVCHDGTLVMRLATPPFAFAGSWTARQRQARIHCNGFRRR